MTWGRKGRRGERRRKGGREGRKRKDDKHPSINTLFTQGNILWVEGDLGEKGEKGRVRGGESEGGRRRMVRRDEEKGM